MSDENIRSKAKAEAEKYLKFRDVEPTDYRCTCFIRNNVCIQDSSFSSTLPYRNDLVFNFIKDVCKDSVCPINSTISIELNDKNETSCDYARAFFSGRSLTVPLVPDLYAIIKYFNKLNIVDKIPHEEKINGAIFIGSSTGSYNPSTNERLILCNKYIDNPLVHCFINLICQITEKDVETVFPSYKKFIRQTMSIEEQTMYKYIISVDGNTSAWDRVPWILNSNSILLLKKSDHKCWYYDFLLPNVHYIPFDDDTDIESIVLSTDDRSHIIRNANQFVKDYLLYEKHKLYMQYFLEFCSVDK
jgi:hypothetical protein